MMWYNFDLDQGIMCAFVHLSMATLARCWTVHIIVFMLERRSVAVIHTWCCYSFPSGR